MATISSIPAPEQLAASIIIQVSGLQNQINQQVNRLQNLVNNGNANVSAADLATALGSANLATINAQLAAILAAFPTS